MEGVSRWQKGIVAELCAVWLLRCRGYRILDRRLRTPYGEIDVVAQHGRCLVIVEVKFRGHLEDALGAITARQQQRLVRGAQHVFALESARRRLDSVRFDAIVMAPWSWPRHLRDAWRP